MALGECPECTFHLVRNPQWREGALISCPDCGAQLVIVSLEPLEVEAAKE